MHPAIRILDCLILIAMLASGRLVAIGLAGLVIVLPLLQAARTGHYPDFRAVYRLRWLFLSIAVLYLLFPPVTVTGWYGHITAGLPEAMLRILALVGIVVLVQTLFVLTDRSQVLAGLLWLLKPLKMAGVSVERFALRLLLALEVLPRVQVLLQSTASVSGGSRLTHAADRLAESFRLVHAEIHRSPAVTMEVPQLAAPSLAQWSTPLLLAGCLAGIMIAG